MLSPDQFGAIIFGFLLALAAFIQIIDSAYDDECAARRSGERCVHGKDHPGSHRDRYGDYWN